MTAINTRKAYTIGEDVSLPECNEGDVVVEYGGLFKLHNRRDWDDGETVTFDGEYLGPAFSDAECSIPPYWRENQPRDERGAGGYWQVQGNNNRRAYRVTDDRPMYYHGWADEERGIPDWRHEPMGKRLSEVIG